MMDDEKEKKEFKEKFKDSVIKKVLEDIKTDMDIRIYEDIEEFEIEKLDENGNYEYINTSFEMYPEICYETWKLERELEKEVMEKNLEIGIKDLEKYLEMNIKDYIELKILEKKYKSSYQANK